MTIENNNELISVREAAKECGRNMETVRRWIWSGKLPAQKLGNQLFIKRGDLASFCNLPARSLVTKVGETAIREYNVEPQTKIKPGDRAGLIKKMRRLRESIRVRTGRDFDVDADIEEMREERMNQIEQSLKDRKHFEGSEIDLLKRVQEVRNRIFARTGTLFDASKDIEKLRKERTDELLHLR